MDSETFRMPADVKDKHIQFFPVRDGNRDPRGQGFIQAHGREERQSVAFPVTAQHNCWLLVSWIFSGARKGCHDNLKAIRLFVFGQWQMGTWLFALDKLSWSRHQRLPTWQASPTRLWYSGLMRIHFKGNEPTPSVLAIYKEMVLFGKPALLVWDQALLNTDLTTGGKNSEGLPPDLGDWQSRKKWFSTLQ